MQDDINYDKKGRVSSPSCPLGWSVRVSLTMGCSLCSALSWYPFTTGGMEKVDPTHVLGGQSKLCLWTTHLLKQHIRKKQTECCAYDLHGAIIGKKKKKSMIFPKIRVICSPLVNFSFAYFPVLLSSKWNWKRKCWNSRELFAQYFWMKQKHWALEMFCTVLHKK